MRSIWVYRDESGVPRQRPLPLPFRRISRPIDPEIFRRQARGEDVGRPRLLEGSALRAVRLGAGEEVPRSARHLHLVVSGEVEIATDDGVSSSVTAGDAFLDEAGSGGRIVSKGESGILQLDVPEAWTPEGALEDVEDALPPDPARSPELLRMYTAQDGKSYFRPFDTLFPGRKGSGPSVPMVGFHFVEFPPGFVIDWHPEGVNNCVFVFTGALELEVGGGEGEIRFFRRGDVCLAEDRIGEGHIDRVHGVNRLALIVIRDENLWPTT